MTEPVPQPITSAKGSQTAIGTIHDGTFPIFIHERVLEEVLAYSESRPRVEQGGFLVGRVHHGDRERVEIRHFLPAVEARSRGASLTFTHETWSQVSRALETQFPMEALVGWQHTHPNFGVFLSPYDLFIHRHFFREPWQVALVVDPQRQELGFFQWRGSAVVDCGFICVKADGTS